MGKNILGGFFIHMVGENELSEHRESVIIKLLCRHIKKESESLGTGKAGGKENGNFREEAVVEGGISGDGRRNLKRRIKRSRI